MSCAERRSHTAVKKEEKEMDDKIFDQIHDVDLKKTMEEKINALNQLNFKYSREEFQKGTFNSNDGTDLSRLSFKDILTDAVEEWERIMGYRKQEEAHIIYAACLHEKDYPDRNIGGYGFFSTYDKAFAFLSSLRVGYMDGDYLKSVETYGEIIRKETDTFDQYPTDIRYYFDNDLRLVNVEGAKSKYTDTFLDEYNVWIDVPFKKGDIVKVESPFAESYYGVFSHEWGGPENLDIMEMGISLDIYIEKDRDFDYTDTTYILNVSKCPDKELPEKEYVLKLIRAVRKGKVDFYGLLHTFSRDCMKDLYIPPEDEAVQDDGTGQDSGDKS